LPAGVHLLRIECPIKTPPIRADPGRGRLAMADNQISPVFGPDSKDKVMGPPMWGLSYSDVR